MQMQDSNAWGATLRSIRKAYVRCALVTVTRLRSHITRTRRRGDSARGLAAGYSLQPSSFLTIPFFAVTQSAALKHARRSATVRCFSQTTSALPTSS